MMMISQVYKAEVEKQLDSKIKVVRSNRGGEFYGKFTEKGRSPGPFAIFLQHEGIVAQYTNPGTPQQNGVSERRNRTLIEMVRSMMCCTALPNFLWGEALKTANYLLNRIPTKSFDRTPYEIWCNRKPSFNHLRTRGCRAEAKLYNPMQKKLDSKTTGQKATDFTVQSTIQEAEQDINNLEDPVTFKQAVESDRCEFWMAAMESELDSMSKNGIWKLVKLPQICIPIGCKWVYKTKKNPQGKIDRYKARLVAKGYTQQEGVDYNETFSPVSTKDSFRVIMALVAHFDLHLHQMDVKTTFLNGNLDEEIYMKQSDGFVLKGEEDLVCKLQKSIYGLKQASRQWYLKFDEVVKSQGFVDNPLDECIYMKFNGTEIRRDRERKLLGLSQKGYVERILKRFNMENCTGCDVPMSKGDKLSSDQSPKTEQEKNGMRDKPYESLVGSLMYAQVCTRPDLAFYISVLGRFQSNSGQAHWVAGGAVAWKSVKQQYVSTSTMQAEFLAIYEATSMTMWLKNFMSMLKVVDSVQRPIQLWNDNSAAVFFAKGNKRSSRMRHLQLKFLSAKEKIRDGQTALSHIGTDLMIVDPLNKALPNHELIVEGVEGLIVEGLMVVMS
ncbi:transposable element gene [Prunus dulcis]|uniref:Transposable element protein n=1 Tax=Prunus dulcis TaxID=3755 RepID=A0A4Y1RWC6_PRUDU|nr:transposable element gene [Prunus dulcis]